MASAVTACATAAGPAPYAEKPLAFDCQGDTLVGILTRPAVPPSAPVPAVLIVVGGPQYRAGSHRQFTLLARALAAGGIASMRFDVRGMGDSGGEPRGFEDLHDDIAAALDALHAELPGAGTVLWGLCDGASAALLYLQQRRDPRVSGLCLVNPWVRSEETLAQTHVKHYYGARLRDPAFWKKLLVGGVGLRALTGLVKSLRLATGRGRGSGPETPPDADFRQRMLAGLQQFGGPLLLVLSGKDYTAREFLTYTEQHPAWRAQLAGTRVTTQHLADADHTLSAASDEQALWSTLSSWLHAIRRG